MRNHNIHKAILILVIALSYTFCNAQSGYKHLNFAGGLNIDGSQQFSASLEINGKYYNSWEIGFDGYRNEDENSNTWQGAIFYEPLIARSGNLIFSGRLGFLMGTNESNFVLGGSAGLELGYSFKNNFIIFLQQKNDYIINVDDRFRHGLLLGFKIPL